MGVHTVLLLQQDDCLRIECYAFFEQSGAEAFTCCFVAFDGRGELAMVAGEYEFPGLDNRYPAAGLYGLAGFVYYYSVVLDAPNGVVVCPDKGSGYYLRFGDKIVNDVLLGVAYFFNDFVGFVEQGFALLAFGFAKAALVFVGHVTELGCALFEGFDFLHGFVFVHLAVEGERHEPLGDTGGVAYAQHIEAFVGKLFAEEIDGCIAGGHYQYLLVVFFYEGFYGLYQSGGFACAGRAMHNGEFVGSDNFIDCFVLYGVEFGVIK